MQQPTSSSGESNDSSFSRDLIHSAKQTSEHTLPLRILPSSPLLTTTRHTNYTQTTQEIQSTFSSKSIPSFAETQLLSVYYPTQNPTNPSTNDRCIFVEQQERQPIRFRATYDPSTKSTQTSPPSAPLSTYASTLIVDVNRPTNPNYDQHLKIHSGSQRLLNNLNDEQPSSNELIKESKYSYEEYIIHLNDKQHRTSSSSSSSVTTVIAQNEEPDSDFTSKLSFDGTNTESSTSSISTVCERPIIVSDRPSTTRVSSWPPVPDDILPIDINDEQKRPSRVQFAEQLVNIIPVSVTNSLSDESLPPAVKPRTNVNESTDVDPRPVQEQLQHLDYHSVNQSKWVKGHLDTSDVRTSTTTSRVNTLRSLFEQPTTRSSDSSTLTSPTNPIRRIEPEEKPSRFGDEIRFRIKESNTSTIHHAEPVKVIEHTTNSTFITPLTWEDLVGTQDDDSSSSIFKLEQIRQITGKQIKSLDDVGYYLQDSHTWRWNEVFWLSLTTTQRDQLKRLEQQQTYSSENSIDPLIKTPVSSKETKPFKSTINVTGAGAWQQQKTQTSTSGITKYSESNTLHETQPSVSVFGSTPNATYSRIGSQESIASSNRKNDSQITVIESGYSSDEPQRTSHFRPNSGTIIEEPSSHINNNNTNSNNLYEQSTYEIHQEPKLDPLSYEQFIYDYLSTNARLLRTNNSTIILCIDGQEIPMTDVHLSSNDNLVLAKNVYLDAINEYPLPFETESNQLFIFISNETVIVPADRWLLYKRKYNNAQWIRKLKRVNRHIPLQLIPIIEQWLADHATFSYETHELNVDGLAIPLIGRLGLHLYQIDQFQTNNWNDVLKYLIHIGSVSYNSDQKLLQIAHSELDAQRLLTSPSVELTERLAKLLRALHHIHFHKENGTLILNENFIIPNKSVLHLFQKHQQGEILNANELASLLLPICDIDEDDQSLILTLNGQILRLTSNEKSLLLESITSLLHFSTLELIDNRRLRLSLNENSPLTDKEQKLEFNENDTKILCQDLELDLHACANYLIDHIFNRIDLDNEKESLFIYYDEQILRIKILKEKFVSSPTRKLRLILKKNHIEILTQWLNRLSEEKLITITEQNDIVILFQNEQNQEQQIFIHHNDVDTYMNKKFNKLKTELISMSDIVQILFLCNYVQYSNGEFIFDNQRIVIDKNELVWLQSIIHCIQPKEELRETEVELFDGQQKQVIKIPFEHMTPTNDPKVVADYLFQNGKVRYDVQTRTYAYSYVIPDIPLRKKDQSSDRINQHQLLSSQIRQIHIDEDNKRIELEFNHEQNHYLLLPSTWYHQISEHCFDRSYIIDMLLTNGGTITQDTFTFNNHSYSLKTKNLSSKQKEDLIDNYVELIHSHDGMRYDKTSKLLLLENPSDGSQLYLTTEHTQYIHQNHYRREDVKYLLNESSEIKRDEFDNWLLYYNNQCIQIPSKSHARFSQENQTEFLNRYHNTIDYMYHHGLIKCDRRLKLIQIHFSNQILTIPIDQLRSIILNSSNENILPFNSQQLSQWLLKNSETINNSREGYIQLTYRNKLYNLPIINLNEDKQSKIDPNLKLLFPFNKSLRLIQKTASNSTLDIQPPSAANGYAIDPLLMLANFIYRAGTVYQDELGRLVIKMNENEIVVPRIEAINAIETINTSPKRTGTIIARLIDRLGKVQSNKAGGLIITISKTSFELSKQSIDRANKFYNENNLTSQSQDTISIDRQSNISTILPSLRHSKSADTLSSSTIGHSWLTDDQQTRYSKDGRGDARYLNLAYKTHVGNDPKRSISINDLTRLNPEQSNRTHSQTSLCLKPRILIVSDDETTNDQTRFYVQYVYEHDNIDTAHIMMLPSRYPVRPTQPQLIAPNHYRDIALREASVCVQKRGEEKIYYENLAQYLSSEYPDLSSRTIRRMLKFTTRDEYLTYLSNKMPLINAEQLVQQSEEQPIRIDDQQRSSSPNTYYNVQNGTTIMESNDYEEQEQRSMNNRFTFSSKSIDRSSSTSSVSSDMLIANTLPTRRTILGNVPSSNIPISYYASNHENSRSVIRRSPQTTNGTSVQKSATPEKAVILPRSATLSGQSNDGESESRATVSRSVSAAAKVVTSKSDTMKSTTSSSAASSREVSPNRTSASKGAGDEVKKEKKSKFRTPSFLRKRKEKKEAGAKEKAEK